MKTPNSHERRAALDFAGKARVEQSDHSQDISSLAQALTNALVYVGDQLYLLRQEMTSPDSGRRTLD